MDKTKKPTFVVDLSETMIVSNISDNSEDKQKLYCSCGSHKTYNSKIMRNIVKNYDELTEDSESLESVTCDNCGQVYDYNKKVYLLSPNKDEMYKIEYALEEKGDTLKLVKKKSFANYSSKSDSITFKEVVDSFSVNKNTNKCTINIEPPFEKTDSFSFKSSFDSSSTFSGDIDITNVSVFEEFFHFIDSIKYVGLEEAYRFLDMLKPKIKDFDKFTKINFLDFLITNNEIIKETDDEGEVHYYQNVDSGFGDGKKIKKALVSGDYLFNLLNSYKLFVSIISFEYSSTIILTKNYDFFKKWIESKYICKPSIYQKHDASNPHSIIEVSLQYDKDGKKRDVVKDATQDSENSGVMKISGTIYNSITSINHLDILNDSYCNGVIKKHELESLFQRYDSKRVYNLISKVTNQNKRNRGEALEIRHIEHMMKNDMDIAENQSDYITVYADTIRVIGLLEQKDKMLFKCKDYASLKEMHDDLSARFNAMKDAKKAEFFEKAVEPFLKYDETIGDIEFKVVPTTERLNLEGLQMHHCIYTYLNRVCDREYIAIDICHNISKERATAGFVRKGDKLELEQLKGFYNSRASAEIIDATAKFCQKNKFKMSTYNSDMTPDRSRQRPMPGQMTEEELAKYRKEHGDNRLKKEGDVESGKKGGFLSNLF
jgi:hypothetical protein